MLKSGLMVMSLLWTFVLQAATPKRTDNALFLSATHDLADGRYKVALQACQILEHKGRVTAALFNNIGCINYQEGRWDQAMLYFEKSISLSPLDTQVVNNLNKTSRRFGSATLMNNAGFNWDNFDFYRTMERISAAVSLVLILACLWLLLLSIRARQSGKNTSKQICRAIIVLCVLSMPVTWAVISFHRTRCFAFARSPASARLGPALSAGVGCNLTSGVKVEIINAYGNWYEVKDYTHRCGWVNRQYLVLIE